MLEFHELDEWPGEPEGTMVRWGVQYGGLPGASNHILVLGILPVNLATRRGCVWLEMLCDSLPLRVLRDARAAFSDFLSLTNWQLVCIVEKGNRKRTHFVEHLGFTPFHETETEISYKGPNYDN